MECPLFYKARANPHIVEMPKVYKKSMIRKTEKVSSHSILLFLTDLLHETTIVHDIPLSHCESSTKYIDDDTLETYTYVSAVKNGTKTFTFYICNDIVTKCIQIITNNR